MSKDITMEDLKGKEAAPTSEAATEKKEEKKVDETSETKTTEQDPLKIELEKVQKTGKTEAEKAAFSLKKNAERAKELGIDPAEVLGLKQPASETTPDEEDDKPVTVGMMKKMQQENASKTAVQQAEEIENETERELVKYHLQNTIKSTGNPKEDLKLARAIVNDVKNRQVLEEMGRKNPPKTHSNASGAPAKDNATDINEELTPAEIPFTKPPFNMTKEQVIKTRTSKKA